MLRLGRQRADITVIEEILRQQVSQWIDPSKHTQRVLSGFDNPNPPPQTHPLFLSTYTWQKLNQTDVQLSSLTFGSPPLQEVNCLRRKLFIDPQLKTYHQIYLILLPLVSQQIFDKNQVSHFNCRMFSCIIWRSFSSVRKTEAKNRKRLGPLCATRTFCTHKYKHRFEWRDFCSVCTTCWSIFDTARFRVNWYHLSSSQITHSAFK